MFSDQVPDQGSGQGKGRAIEWQFSQLETACLFRPKYLRSVLEKWDSLLCSTCGCIVYQKICKETGDASYKRSPSHRLALPPMWCAVGSRDEIERLSESSAVVPCLQSDQPKRIPTTTYGGRMKAKCNR